MSPRWFAAALAVVVAAAHPSLALVLPASELPAHPPVALVLRLVAAGLDCAVALVVRLVAESLRPVVRALAAAVVHSQPCNQKGLGRESDRARCG